jgi:hypothetical protein
MIDDNFDLHPTAPFTTLTLGFVSTCIKSAVTSFSIIVQVWKDTEPWRRLMPVWRWTFDDFKSTGFIEFNGLQSVIKDWMGLTADYVTNSKTVLRLSCFAYSYKEFSIMPIDCPLNTQCVSQVAMAALIK